jgi:hypothetical protein
MALSGAELVAVSYEGALYRRHPQSQVATTPKPTILVGRLFVSETLAEGMLSRSDLLREHGEALFWSLRAMWRQAKDAEVPSETLRRAENLLRQIATMGPSSLRGSLFVRSVGLLGPRWAEALLSLTGRSTPGTLPKGERAGQ